ncbi:5-methyltetrahydropteroyltriglutamate--homocysteine S-methyltransferase, partial [Aliarcobacter butzleri]
YHYIGPEISNDTKCTFNSKKVMAEYKEAFELGKRPKINLIGAITYLGLSKRIDNSDIFTHSNSVVEVYKELVLETSK